MQVECNTPLESSQGELQVCFRPHPNRKYEQGVMSYQSPGSPNWDSPGTKSHLDLAPVEWRRVYYMGEGGCRNPTLAKCGGEA
jgi:hypothetical protein